MSPQQTTPPGIRRTDILDSTPLMFSLDYIYANTGYDR